MADERGRGPEALLFSEESRAPRAYHLSFLLPLALVAVTAHVGVTPLAVPIASGLVLVVLWQLFSVLRVTVSKDSTTIRHGIFGPHIPPSAIERCDLVDLDGSPLAWGTHHDRDGAAIYSLAGDRAQAVRIAYRQGKKAKTVLVAPRDPTRLAAAIEEARAGATPPEAGTTKDP